MASLGYTKRTCKTPDCDRRRSARVDFCRKCIAANGGQMFECVETAPKTKPVKVRWHVRGVKDAFSMWSEKEAIQFAKMMKLATFETYHD